MKKRNSDKLQNAIQSLDNAIRYSRSPEFQELGIEFKNVLISAVVQNFSLTFRVCQQMIAHQLIDRYGATKIEQISSNNLFQLAAQEGLISNLDQWLEYLDCEHLSQSSSIAIRTFEKASVFLKDAEELLRTCSKRINNERRKVA
ncbi:MAG: nucleotidyltransferase substrate binding protein [Planctomycetaceae bacterium]|jgi:EAL domain-containing protein (putative c-di-GMP-specific phosphodiesterase class I)|nr:nucleotidyltransferase substrate binding protein [Planctomycetaceae bacterium]